ncbi:MAG TPA: chorismate synthase, partial [Acidimicrobiales bacterium]|nr:chorismate synthase [Acidimicrobiales bacterium]
MERAPPRVARWVGVAAAAGPGRDGPLGLGVVARVDSAAMLRFLTAGESHGKALVVIVEGLPAGLPVTAGMVSVELARRRLGYGRGPRMRFEQDEISLIGGVRHGRTLGSPVAIEIANTEWPKWEQEMSAAPGLPEKVLTQPRPGHADLAGMQKYGFDDARDVLERASARETAARVAAGSLAKALLAHLGISVVSHVVALGAARARLGFRPLPEELDQVDASQVRCFDPEAEEAMVDEVKAAAKVGDSLGGVAEVLAYGVPVGLGSHVHFDRKIDGLIAQALMSIQAVKGVEIGDALDVSSRRGSEAHDAVSWDPVTESYVRETSRAGGIEGGITTGALLVARAVMKPLATLNRPVLKTVDVVTKQETVSFKERTDVTAVPAMGVVAETMVALVLASEVLRKFGGDSLAELLRNRDGFLAALHETPSSARAAAGSLRVGEATAPAAATAPPA